LNELLRRNSCMVVDDFITVAGMRAPAIQE
jgi:hypothetical protein